MKHVLFSLLCLLTLTAHAQETHVIEPADLEVRYVAYYEGEYLKTHGKLSNTFILRCGKTTAQYFCRESLWTDSLSSSPEGFHIWYEHKMAELKRYENGGDRPTHLPDYGEWIYRTLSSNVTSTYRSMMGEGLVIRDSAQINWTLVDDSTKSVLGYECHLAETDFRGRHWKAWYTMDIPVSLGPWKLSGLPGLILAAEIPGLMNIKAYKIATKNLTPVTFYNYFDKKFTDIPFDKYLLKRDNVRYPKGTLIAPQLELK